MSRTEFEEKLRKEQAEQAALLEFKANPVPNPAPFIPSKSTKAPTECEEVVLHTQDRAVKRDEFDQELKRKEEEEARMMEAIKARQAVREEIENIL